jgi:hypothetical protein
VARATRSALIAVALLALTVCGLLTAPVALAATVPAAPANVVAVGGDETVSVTWDAPADGGSPITSYLVELWTDSDVRVWSVELRGDARAHTFSGPHTNLWNDRLFEVRVWAANAVGRSADHGVSGIVRTAGPPSQPAVLSPIAGPDGSVRLRWQGSSDNGAPVTRYDVTLEPGGLTTSLDATTWPDGPSSPAQQYWMDVDGLPGGLHTVAVVRATNLAGTGSEDWVRFRADDYVDGLEFLDTLPAGEVLLGDEELRSANGRFSLAVQTDGNVVTYADGARALWASRTTAAPGYSVYLHMQDDGNLVVYGNYGPVWHSATWGNPGARLVVQDDGNVVLYAADGAPLWTTGPDRGAGAPRDTMAPTEQLTAGQALTSANGAHTLLIQGDGNVAVYGPDGRAPWSTGTWSRPGSRLRLQPDGNLVVYDGDLRAVWNSGTWGNANTRLLLQDDGNLVLYAADGRALWSYRTGRLSGAAADTMAPAQQLTAGQTLTSADRSHRLVVQGDGNVVVYGPDGRARWSTGTWSRPGNTLRMQPDGNLVVYDSGTFPVWSSGTWGNADARLLLQDDGNLVLYAANGRALWSYRTGRLR